MTSYVQWAELLVLNISLQLRDVYFVSCSHDTMARLWTCDLTYPLRIFAGHTSGVNVCLLYVAVFSLQWFMVVTSAITKKKPVGHDSLANNHHFCK